MAKTISFKNGSTKAEEEGLVAKVHNEKGYLDLLVFVNKNGKSVRIESRDGSNRVFISRKHIDALFSAIKMINTQGVRTSTDVVEYSAA